MESARYLALLRVLVAHDVEFILVLRDDALEFELGDVTVQVLGLERLIQSKEYAGRGKDLAVLPALRATLAQSKKT
jgi:hypothetical protein